MGMVVGVVCRAVCLNLFLELIYLKSKKEFIKPCSLALFRGRDNRLVIRILLFFASQRKRSKRKAARKFGLRLPSILQLPEAVTKTRYAQTVCDLIPHAIASLGCTLMGRKSYTEYFDLKFISTVTSNAPQRFCPPPSAYAI